MSKTPLIPFRHSNYLSRVFTSPASYKLLMERSMERFDLISTKHKIDAIAFIGISGASIGFPLACMKNVSPICFRKEVSTHASSSIEGPYSHVKNYLIVDDLMDTGKTITGILDGMYPHGSICRGILLSDGQYDYYNGTDKHRYKRRKIPIYGI